MRPAFLQVSESADGYESVTIALFALFVVLLAITAGLLLRDILQTNRSDISSPTGSPDSIPVSPPLQSVAPPERKASFTPIHQRNAQPPAWYRQAVAGQSPDAVAGIRATIERMVEAANRGDLRLGFSLYTPEFLGRQQQAMGLDAGEFERLLRNKPHPADPPLVIERVVDVVLDPPYRAVARVAYRETTKEQRPDEQIHLMYDESDLIWLIDDIVVLDEATT